MFLFLICVRVSFWCRKHYRKLSFYTWIALYVLIGAGGLVRSTGSGMGCPDWPKCYGRWVPPLSEQELPSDYRARYYAARKAKNVRLATWLQQFGWHGGAEILRKEASVFRSEPFDPFKAWAEYVNRLLGLCVGVLALATGFLAIGYLGTSDRSIFWFSLAGGLGILLAGLLGALVVATHLLPFTVTVHMGVAFLVIFCLMAAHRRATVASRTVVQLPKGLQYMLWALFLLFLGQVFLGTQVREGVDHLLSQQLPRDQVLDIIGTLFYVHRGAAVLLFLGHVGVCYYFWRRGYALSIQRLAQGITVVYAAGIVLGMLLYYWALPMVVQPFHLLLAFVAYGLQLRLLMTIHQGPTRKGADNRPQ